MVLSKTELFFGDHSPLHRASAYGGPSYETRPQQTEMAMAVAQAMDDKASLCVEAPTGVGKTFAYLVPAYYHALRTEKPVVISTHTINLQEQITSRDVPLLSRLLETDINCKIAKGRGHYLCKYRVATDLEGPYLPGTWQARFIRWANDTDTGDRSEFRDKSGSLDWSLFNCSRENCVGKSCPHRNDCFLVKARRALQSAQIIVANHAYLISALTNDKDNTLLPDFSGLIIDEAHTIPTVAATLLGKHPGTWELKRMLLRLAHEADGLLAAPAGTQALACATTTLSCLNDYVPQLANFVLCHSGERGNGILRLVTPQPDGNPLSAPLKLLQDELIRCRSQVEAQDNDRAGGLQEYIDQLEEFIQGVTAFYDVEFNDWAYWYELYGPKHQEVSFNSVPIDPANELQKLFFNRKRAIPVVVTSATLAIDQNLHYYKRQIGAYDARELILSSPFDYQEQVTLYTPVIPEPNVPGYQDELNDQLKKFIQLSRGRAFVLFTSYFQLQQSATALKGFLKDGDYTLLAQGDKLSPRMILEKFRTTPRAVVFGTDSFWTGVDVPGDALSNVIITRLPFAQMGHPIIQARDELCRSQGRNSFSDYMLPEAVLKFRQGFGRLIRTRQDTGIIVLLDGRLHQKSYGKIFLNSIPTCKQGLS